MFWKTDRNLGTALTVAEVNALVRYALEKKKDPEGGIISSLEAAKAQWEKNSDDPQKYNHMLKNYVVLSAKTAPISGRVLLDSEYSGRHLCWLVLSTVLLIFVAAAEGVLRFALQDLTPPHHFELFSAHGIQYVLDYLNPYVWGALGACVYLLKHLYDIASRQQFDAVLFRGWWVRLVLGAVLGGVVNQIFNFQSEEGAAVAVAELSKNAVAFLTGLGVRVVYGAFERAVQLLAEKMNIGRTAAAAQSRETIGDARAVLVEALAKIDPKQTPAKHKALLEVIASLGEQKDEKSDEPGK